MRQPSSEWHFMSDYIKRAPRVSWKFAVFKGLRDFWYLHIVIYFCDEFRLEEKKRQKKPEIKDPKLQELQERLEARKAGKWDTWTNFISSLYTIIHNSIIYTSWSAFSSRSYFFSSGSSSILLFSCCFPSHIFILSLCFDRTKEGKWKAGCCPKKEFSWKTESSADGEGLSIHVVLNVAPSANWQLL